MRNSFFLVLFAVPLCLISGCSSHSPLQEIPYLGEKKTQSTQEWNVLANDVANRINNELIRQHYLNSSVHVRHSCETSHSCRPGEIFPFDEGFNDLLNTQLASFGINTLKTQEDAGLVVEYKVQLVYHGHYEAIITTSIVDKGKFVMQSSDILPIDNDDFWKYRQVSSATEIELTDRHGARQPSTSKASSL